MTPGELINLNEAVDWGDNRTDVDEIITSMLQDGKIDEADREQLTSLQAFFESERAQQLDDTRAAMGLLFQDMLTRGYTITEGNIGMLQFILDTAGLNVQLQTLLDTEESLRDNTFSLILSEGVVYVNAEQPGDVGDIIRFGYFWEDGAYVQNQEDWYRATDNFADNNTLGSTQIEDLEAAVQQDIMQEAFAQLDTTQEALTAAEDLAAERLITIGELQSANTDLEAQVAALEPQVTSLTASLTALGEENARIQWLLDTAETQRDELRDDLLEAQATITGLQDQITQQLQPRITELEGAQWTLQTRIAELEASLSGETTQRETLQAELGLLQSQRDALQARITELEANLAAASGEISQRETDIGAMFRMFIQREMENSIITPATTMEEISNIIGSNQQFLQDAITYGITDLGEDFWEYQEAAETAMRDRLRIAIAELGTQYQHEWSFTSIQEAQNILETQLPELRRYAQQISFPETVINSVAQRAESFIQQSQAELLQQQIELRTSIQDLYDRYFEEQARPGGTETIQILELNSLEEAQQLWQSISGLSQMLSAIGEDIIDAPILRYKLTQLQDIVEGYQEQDTGPQPQRPTLWTQVDTEDVSVGELLDLDGVSINLNHRVSREYLSTLEGAENPTKEMIQTLLEWYLERFPVWRRAEQQEFWQSEQWYHVAYAVQVGLTALGKNLWNIDGIWWPRSQAALEELGQWRNPGPNSIRTLLEQLQA